jgi:intergrase/recombinase
MYEIGIAHTIGKPTFLCMQRIAKKAARVDVPFDVKHVRIFFYDKNDLNGLQRNIAKFIAEPLDQ